MEMNHLFYKPTFNNTFNKQWKKYTFKSEFFLLTFTKINTKYVFYIVTYTLRIRLTCQSVLTGDMPVYNHNFVVL